MNRKYFGFGKALAEVMPSVEGDDSHEILNFPESFPEMNFEPIKQIQNEVASATQRISRILNKF